MSSSADANESQRSARTTKPGWLVTVCVIAIALGGMGLTKGLWHLATSALGGSATTAIFAGAEPTAENAGQAEVEKALGEIQAIDRKYAVLTTLSSILRVAIAVGLIFGGVWCLWGKPAGRTLLSVVFIAGLIFEIGDTALQTRMTFEIVKPMEQLGQAIEHGGAAAAEPAQGALAVILRSLVWAVMCVVYLLQAAKGVYYLGGLLYLRRSSLDLLFAAPAATEPAL